MTDKAKDRNTDKEVSTEKKLEDLYEMIDEIETCMLTTRRADGYLVSRAMQVQQRTDQGNLWFVTDESADKLDELNSDSHVNCAFYKDKTREWISVSGIGRISRDRAKIRELYKPDWKAWLGDRGGEMDGGPNDPRIALIFVEAHSVEYLKKDRPAFVQLFSFAKAMVTGDPPKMGDQRSVTPKELPHESGRELR